MFEYFVQSTFGHLLRTFIFYSKKNMRIFYIFKLDQNNIIWLILMFWLMISKTFKAFLKERKLTLFYSTLLLFYWEKKLPQMLPEIHFSSQMRPNEVKKNRHPCFIIVFNCSLWVHKMQCSIFLWLTGMTNWVLKVETQSRGYDR